MFILEAMEMVNGCLLLPESPDCGQALQCGGDVGIQGAAG